MSPARAEHDMGFRVRWGASVLRIFGSAARGFGLAPRNIHFFIFGLVGWVTVGVLWTDRATTPIDIVAFGSMRAGHLST